ncbi:hypothetical protein [Methylobacterium brachythecii]|uniref:Uncharacterized protein n=1 Tax=Methylobacterium brachythecii TaxID=1176177 RepID=A0A7W6AL72_9HYPH|nr:hypothetical protein [Methylobacterium brachythecii]MBB3901787.1 hypothetical protein [Methylobacterium brachythecii]GLS43165.1 hypothetical protein GCM10007884_11500 [Methylobacterium brachythecii]
MTFARVLLTSTLALAQVAPAAAQQRLATNRMTCTDAKALVKQDGDVVLATGPGLSERIVADRGYCELTEIAELRFVPTRDNLQCPVGYRCKAPEFEDWNGN